MSAQPIKNPDVEQVSQPSQDKSAALNAEPIARLVAGGNGLVSLL